MDQELSDGGVYENEVKELQHLQPLDDDIISCQSFHSEDQKIMKKLGRPSLQLKNRQRKDRNLIDIENEYDEDFQVEKPKNKDRSFNIRQERESSLDGFIKIIDYLKKIQCDQKSLHNKMNPYNMLTATCFWYMVSAEYFSQDFYATRNPLQAASELIRRAQRTQIQLPLRFIKPLRIQTQLQFETAQLKSYSHPITEKLTSLSGSFNSTNSSNQIIEKSGVITSIAEDNAFRSSTRALIFGWVKNKLNSNEKWASVIRPKLKSCPSLPPMEIVSRVFECESEMKHQQLQVAAEVHYRPRKIQKNDQQVKPKVVKKLIIKKIKINKKAQQDDIYDESQSPQNNFEKIAPNNAQKDQEYHQSSKSEKENQKIIDPVDPVDPVDHLEPQKQEPQHKINNEEKIQVQDEVKNEQIAQQEHEKEAYQTVKITKNYTQDDILLDALLHLPIDNIINILRSSIDTHKLPQLQKPFMPPPKNDPLELVYQTHPDEELFLDYMKQRQQRLYQRKVIHNQSLIEQKEREGQIQDAKCQVCTDGDYTEDNLIVFCSMCNISLHQRCVGLAKVPADNWICKVCASFGPAGINVPCPLCNVKGGSLKRTSIHINTPLFKDTNPEYHQYAKKCPNYKHKQQYVHPKGQPNSDQPYYDYFSKVTYPNDEPVCHYVWVHYVCAIWIPQCYFQEKNGLINIKGVENIDKKRFKEKCLVCKQVKAGACVKCDNENCTKFYHPQCARKMRIYMEQLNLDKLKYLIFCEAHEPLKVKRKIEVKKKKQRDEIVKFCRGIEKYVQTYKIVNLPFKLYKIGTANNNIPVGKIENRRDNKALTGEINKLNQKIEKDTDEDFIKLVTEGLIRQNQIIVNLACLGSERYKVEEIIKPSKRDMRKSLTRQDEFWKSYKSNQTPEGNLRRFNNIMRENSFLKLKIQNFINFGTNPEDLREERVKRSRRKREKVQTVIQEKGSIFCVCRKPYNGQDGMFQCEVCNEWYHYDCIGFIGSQEEAQQLTLHCMKCLKFESAQTKKELLEKCQRFFSQDSLYLNYRPPTPSLCSEQENKDFLDEIKVEGEMKNENLQKIENYKPIELFDIEPELINLQFPFLIISHENDEVIQHEEHQAPQKQAINPIKIREGQENIEAFPRSFSNSSQFATPQFRPLLYSFAGDFSEMIGKQQAIGYQVKPVLTFQNFSIEGTVKNKFIQNSDKKEPQKMVNEEQQAQKNQN